MRSSASLSVSDSRRPWIVKHTTGLLSKLVLARSVQDEARTRYMVEELVEERRPRNKSGKANADAPLVSCCNTLVTASISMTIL